jgi:hypothetical protein
MPRTHNGTRPAISVEGLVKSFGEVRALAGQYAAVDDHLAAQPGWSCGRRSRTSSSTARRSSHHPVPGGGRLAGRRIAVIDRGHVIAEGTADELKDRVVRGGWWPTRS